MSESSRRLAHALATTILVFVQVYWGVDLSSTKKDVTTQKERVEKLSTDLAIQSTRIDNTIEQQIENTLAVHNQLQNEVDARVANLIEVKMESSQAAALRLAEDARELGREYRTLLDREVAQMEARERDLQDQTRRVRDEARSAIAELGDLKAVLSGAADQARLAAVEANASPRYVMVEDGAGPARFSLPHHGAFQARLDDVVDAGGQQVAHVVVQAGTRDPIQLRLGEFSGFQALPDTRWVVRPALVHDALTLFGRRRIVILELIPSEPSKDPSATPVLHTPGAEPPDPGLEHAAG